MQQSVSNLGLCQAFLAFEEAAGLLSRCSVGGTLWEYVRLYAFQELQRRYGLVNMEPFLPLQRLHRWLRQLRSSVGGMLSHHPFPAASRPFLFFGCPRRSLGPDGLWWDTTVDPFLDSLPGRYYYLERPSGNHQHCTPARTTEVRYQDWFSILTCSHRVLTRMEPLPKSACQFLLALRARIEKHFGVAVDLLAMASTIAKARHCLLYQYRRLLRKVRPRIVFFASINYPERAALEMSRQLGLPTVELQHGVIGPTDLCYVFPKQACLRCFPDYLFVYGPYWQQCIDYPLPRERIVPVGNPYLESAVRQYEERPKKEQILVISQPTLGTVLSRFALELARHPECSAQIVYRLHPNETEWKQQYPWLANSRVQISDGRDRNLHALLAESRAQLGVHSAALFEGLAFGLPTYLLDLPGVENLRPLIKAGVARTVNDPGEVLARHPRMQAVSRDWFFRTNSLQHFREAVARILASAAPRQGKYEGFSGGLNSPTAA